MSAPDESTPHITRRKILQFAGLAAGAATFPTTCKALTTPTEVDHAAEAANPTSVSREQMSRIVLVKTEDRIAGTLKAIDLLQPDTITGKTVYLKPNYNTADPAPAATDTRLLEALIQELQNAKAEQLRSAGTPRVSRRQRSGMANTREGTTSKVVVQLADRYGVNAIVLDELSADNWQLFPAQGTHWSRGYAFARPILNAGAIVNTCCLKTHRFGGHFPLSLRNSVGMVAKYFPGNDYNYMSELHSSPHQRLRIAEIDKAYQPALVLLPLRNLCPRNRRNDSS